MHWRNKLLLLIILILLLSLLVLLLWNHVKSHCVYIWFTIYTPSLSLPHQTWMKCPVITSNANGAPLLANISLFYTPCKYQSDTATTNVLFTGGLLFGVITVRIDYYQIVQSNWTKYCHNESKNIATVGVCYHRGFVDSYWLFVMASERWIWCH